MDDYIDKVAVPQVREILTHYGEFPAVLWWDTPTDMNKERAEKLLPLLKLKPGIIHNNRLGGGYKGDTETPEQFIPATGYPGRDWETCMTMNDTWGFKSYDHNWKSTETLIRNLVDIASKGGNYLLNVGPTSEGLIPGPVRRAPQGSRPMDEGQRRGHLRHHRQPVQTPALGPLHQEAHRGRRDPLPPRLQLAGRTASCSCPASRTPPSGPICWPIRQRRRSPCRAARKG